MNSDVAHPVKSIEIAPPKYDGEVLDVHVVILNNYVRVHHAVSYVELAKRVRKLTVLLSVPMEPNKDCLLYTSPSPRDRTRSRMPSSA